MNIFNRILGRERAGERFLGNPLSGLARLRRLTFFANLTNGKGFREYPKPVRTYSDGTTRGDRKRAARVKANARYEEDKRKRAEEIQRRTGL